MSLLTPEVSFNHQALRRRTFGLLVLGASQLLLFLSLAIQNFYWGSNTILLKVQATLELDRNQATHLSRIVDSPFGAYVTGTHGDLLYHPSSLGDYLLYYNIGNFNILSTLFIFFITLYLYITLRQLVPGRELTASIGKAFSIIGVSSVVMYMVDMAFNTTLFTLFHNQTQHLFYLLIRDNNLLYVVFGSLLLVCPAFFELGGRLQRDNELTI
jgi:hypothetical protein